MSDDNKTASAQVPVIIGAGGGGKGGGGARAATEAKDTLRSKQYATVVDALCEGEIEGLVNGAQSIFLDDTPLQNPDGSYNFRDVTAMYAPGTQSQGGKIGLSGNLIDFPLNAGKPAVTEQVGVEMIANQPVVRTITNADVDWADVTIGIPQLTYQNPSTGDISGSSVQFKIELQTAGGGWKPAAFDNIWTDKWLTQVAHAHVRSDLETTSQIRIYAPVSLIIAGAYLEYRRVGESSWVRGGKVVASLSPLDLIVYANPIWGAVLPQSESYWETPVLPMGRWEARLRNPGGTAVSSSSVRYSQLAQVDYLTISGKTTSRYQRTYRIALPGTGPWDIRLTRISPMPENLATQNRIWWDSMTEGTDVTLRYPNTALVGISIDAEQFRSVPTRGYDIKGLRIKVPTNYNPATRTYTGSWDGNFKIAWSDNPAWCFYDLLTNERYGLGEYLDASQVDKWRLYEIGRYCDELVPNGLGGMEPRFTCNLYLQNREDAYRVINWMASIFRGMAYWADGQITAVHDAPADPVALFTAANVIDGQFNYQGSDIRTRHTVVLVAWNDPADRYRQKIEYVADEEAIAKRGVIQTEIAAVGCTSRGQAHRVGRWLLYTEQHETEVVTFRAGLDAARVAPGDVILTQDAVRSGKRYGGRVVSATAVEVKLDAPVTVEPGKTYELSVVLPDGSVQTRPASSALGESDTFAVSPAFTLMPQSSAIWVLTASDLEPERWRVLTVSEVEPTVVEIVAVSHNPSKYAHVEQGLKLEPLETSSLSTIPEPPKNITHVEHHYPATAGMAGFKAVVSWSGDSPRYLMQWRRAGQEWNHQELLAPVFTLDNIAADDYEFRIASVNSLGRSSRFVDYNVTMYALLPAPEAVPSAYLQVIDQERMELYWTPIPTPYAVQYEVRTADANWGDGNHVFLGSTTSCVVPPAAAGQTTQYFVRAVNYQGTYATASATAQFAVQAPSAPSVSGQYIGTKYALSWTESTGTFLINGYEIRQGATWESATVVARVKATELRVAVNWTSAQTFWVAAYDIKGNMGTPTSQAAPFAAPSAPTVSGSFSENNYVLTWTESTGSLPIATYEVRQGASWATGAVVGRVTATQLSIPVTWTGSRTFWVAGIDQNGNVGTASSRSVTPVGPSAVSGASVSYSQGTATLQWTGNKGSLPIAQYEVRRGAAWTEGALVGRADTNTLSVEVNWTSSATFWIVAYDALGQSSVPTQLIATIVGPGSVTVAHQFKDGNLILTWNAPSTGSLGIRHYEVREGATWNTGSLVGTTTDRSYSIPVNWTSSKTFWVAAVDSAGNVGVAGSRTVTYSMPGSVSGLQATLNQANATLQWQAATAGSLPITQYEIRHGGSFATGEVVGRADTTTLTIPVTWTGSRTFWVVPLDSNGQYGTEVSTVLSISAPSAPSVTSAIVVAKADLSWTTPSSSLPIREYEIRQGASWATGTLVTRTLATNYRVPIDWTGSRTFWVAAVDVNGNVGAAGSRAVTINAPAAPVLSSAFNGELLVLSWTVPGATLPIGEYEIRHGSSWAAGTSLGRISGTTLSTRAQWAGSRTWWVVAYDINGNAGTPASLQVTITAPSAPQISKQVVDNNVLLYWTESTGTLPVQTYEIRKGSAWGSAELIGQKAGGFTTVFETAAGDYTYLVAAIDTAGNVGTPGVVTVSVSQPPDYVLRHDLDLDFSGTKVNMAPDVDGSYVMPVNAAETQAQHFTSRSWSTPQNQVDAGYPIFIQPALSPGYYEHEIDYGTLLAGTKISVTATGATVSGTPTLRVDISTRATPGDAWTDYPDMSSVFATAFRYVKVRFTVTGDDKALYRLQRLNVKLDAKLRNDAGRVTLTPGGAHANGNLAQDYVKLWVPGMSMPPSGFALNGGTAENKIALGAGPSGVNEPLWVCVDNDTASDNDGGWDGGPFPIDATRGHLYAVFMRTATNNGQSYWGTATNGTILNLAGTANTNPYFWNGDLPALNTWYLIVGYVHPIGHGTASANLAGIYDLTGTRLVAGTEFKYAAGTTTTSHRAYHYYNTTGSVQDVQFMARPVVIPCTVADAPNLIQYLLRCATQLGAMAEFGVPFIDIASLQVSPAGTTPSIAVYDFLDQPNPTRFNIFNYSTAGTPLGGEVAWSARGY